MKLNSFLKLKHMACASGALVAAILVTVVARSGAKASVQPPSAPVVEVAAVEERRRFPFTANGSEPSPGR